MHDPVSQERGFEPARAGSGEQWFELAFAIACLAAVTWFALMMGVGTRPHAQVEAQLADTRGIRMDGLVDPAQRAESLVQPLVPPQSLQPAPSLAVPLAPLADSVSSSREEPASAVDETVAPEAKTPGATVPSGSVAGHRAAAPSHRGAQRRTAAAAYAQAPKRSRGARSRAVQHAASGVGCRQGLAIAREFCAALRCATPDFRRHPVCMQMAAHATAVREQYAASDP